MTSFDDLQKIIFKILFFSSNDIWIWYFIQNKMFFLNNSISQPKNKKNSRNHQYAIKQHFENNHIK